MTGRRGTTARPAACAWCGGRGRCGPWRRRGPAASAPPWAPGSLRPTWRGWSTKPRSRPTPRAAACANRAETAAVTKSRRGGANRPRGRLCTAWLQGSGVMVCAVVGFPLGAMSPTAKAYEAREAVRQGAQEIDMVVNIGALKSRDYETVFEDICRVVKGAHPAKVKVILEM